MSADTVSRRRAQTKGVSMRPEEIEDARVVEDLTGVGFSELYHRHFAPQLHAAAEMLLEARDAGMELDRARLRTEWDLTMSQDQLAAAYVEESELSLGE